MEKTKFPLNIQLFADEVGAGTMIKKYMIALFIDTSGNGAGYKRIKKSTELEITTEANN